MDDSWFVVGFVILLIYVILMPIVVLSAYRRSAHNQRQTERLGQTVAQLQSELARVSAQVTQLSRQPSSLKNEDDAPEAERAAPAAAARTYHAPAKAAGSITIADRGMTPSAAASASASADNEQTASSPSHSGLFSSLAGWLLRGNPLAKIGILLLFFGLAYLMKYTIERDMLAIEWRLGIAALISGGLLSFGWYLRHKQRLYALILQGGAVGALYITVFGAFRLYLLLPHTLAFALLLAICAASVGLAVLQRSLSLAMLASTGGYLAPVLLSDGGGNHVVLFSYYLLLSLGILAISARQSWRELNLLGLIFTFGVAILWGTDHYQPDYYLSSQLFLISNILIFGVGALWFSLRHQQAGKQIVDGILLFAPPLIGFGIQYLIVQQWLYGPALSALGYGLFYLLLGTQTRTGTPRLGLFSFALGGCFLTLAVPLAFSAEWTSMTWLLEGLCVLWAGLYQQQRGMGRSGAAIMLLGVLSAGYALFFETLSTTSFLFIFGILAMSALYASLCWQRYRQVETHWRGLSRGFFILGIAGWLGWLLYAVDSALDAYIGDFWRRSEFISSWNTHALLYTPLALLAVAASALIWQSAGKRLNWAALRHSSWLLWGAMLLALLEHADSRQLPLLNAAEQCVALGCWLASFAVAYGLLHRNEASLPLRLTQGFHLSLFWMLIVFLFLLASQYLYPLIPPSAEEGDAALTFALLSIIIIALALPARHRLWPLTAWGSLYNRTGLVPPIAALFTLLASANLMDGQIAWHEGSVFYIPLFNPLEAGMVLGMAALTLWYRRTRPELAPNGALSGQCRFGLWLLSFWLLNGLLLRSLAWYAQIPWSGDALWHSRLVQTTFALLWSLSALIGMVWSTRRQQRVGWLSGALLLGATIIKLFLVDSAGGGGLARAVAFIGVAILILIVGYFAPLPPKHRNI
ncbi:DUF2339 domain-containing protein [Brenneria izadpanahii]|uniref:DUF2339 domain-containing protein n=1 Tax=Brenneria izadpanahii TaxID=2722756 RepID=A0ABX7UUE3_9GAMM|nr:DUF2339 domain-containing protein [Brenneria izadpanahii]QTF08506.1 DUF2339 domain-containing protein [Brenneria izadpanahii]